MTNTKPYLIRAIREWACDNSFTPQILVDATMEGVHVPTSHVKDGQIVLNISDQAVEAPELGNDHLSFSARFNGNPFRVDIPVESVLAIYARENGQGIFFREPGSPPEPTPKDVEPTEKPATRPHLKLVK